MKMRIVTLAFLFLLSSCASVSRPAPPENSAFQTGLWEGELRWISNVPVDGEIKGSIPVVLATCAEQPRFYWKLGSPPKWGRNAKGWTVTQAEATLVLQFVDKSDGMSWVETQSLALIVGPESLLLASWSRSVDNRAIPETDISRRFAQTAIGNLAFVSNECGQF